jgi:hypothetical protein
VLRVAKIDGDRAHCVRAFGKPPEPVWLPIKELKSASPGAAKMYFGG